MRVAKDKIGPFGISFHAFAVSQVMLTRQIGVVKTAKFSTSSVLKLVRYVGGASYLTCLHCSYHALGGFRFRLRTRTSRPHGDGNSRSRLGAGSLSYLRNMRRREDPLESFGVMRNALRSYLRYVDQRLSLRKSKCTEPYQPAPLNPPRSHFRIAPRTLFRHG